MNIHYISELIGTKSISELDFELQNSFGFDYDVYDDFIEIRKGDWKKHNTCEATPIKIDDLIVSLINAKEKGANYVEIEDHCDHHGYEISFLKIDAATNQEIKNYQKKSEEKNKRERAARKRMLEEEIERLSKDD